MVTCNKQLTPQAKPINSYYLLPKRLIAVDTNPHL